MVLDKQSTANGKPATNPRSAVGGTQLTRAAASPSSNIPSTLRKEPKFKGASAPNDQPEEDLSTPVKAFLNSNITPRSGSRKARLNSASPTPNGTPRAPRPVSMIERWDDGLAGRHGGAEILGIQSVDRRNKRAQSISGDGPSPRPYSRPLSVQSGPAGPRVASPESSPAFFRADEAKPRVPTRPDQRPTLRTVFSGYTQDGGDDDVRSRSSVSTSSPSEDKRPKFFRANSSVEAVPSAIRRSPRQATFSPQQASSHPRAASPLKDEITSRDSSLNEPPAPDSRPRKSSVTNSPRDDTPSRKPSLSSPRRHTRLVSTSISSAAKDIKAPEAATSNLSRRSSLNTPSPRRTNHVKTASVDGIDNKSVRRNSMVFSDISPQGPTSPSSTNAPRPSSISQQTPLYPSSHQALPLTVSPLTTAPIPAATPPLSPIRPSQPPAHSKLETLNEQAANARRERKVLDLEISNSSLLAINRTLEREMRKQKEELHRLRRRTENSRAVSMATATTRSFSERFSTLSGVAPTDEGETYNSDASSLENFELEDEEDTTRSLSSSTSSPPPPYRTSFARDTKRLQLDLSRHRALLVSSQCLNQSIKRCLDTTESLIAEGKKALDHRIQTPDLEPLPRVLSPHEKVEDDEQQQQPSRGLLSPAIDTLPTNPWDALNLNDLIHPLSSSSLPPETEPLQTPNPNSPPNPQPSPTKTTPLKIPLPPTPSKTGWDAIKADVQTPDALRGVHNLSRGLGLMGGYLSGLAGTTTGGGGGGMGRGVGDGGGMVRGGVGDDEKEDERGSAGRSYGSVD